MLADIERLKRLLWHGNLCRAGPAMDDLQEEVEALEMDYPHRGKFARAAREFAVYIAGNTDSIINYGERFRAGERISSAFIEATVNTVISKRFAKHQQMQWTPHAGARHLGRCHRHRRGCIIMRIAEHRSAPVRSRSICRS